MVGRCFRTRDEIRAFAPRWSYGRRRVEWTSALDATCRPDRDSLHARSHRHRAHAATRPRHPLLLLALEARDRNLLLARHVGVVPYVLVGNARRLCTDPLFYLLGRHYGPTAVVWLKDHGGGAIVAATERAFRRAAYPMLVIFPGAVVCTLAGDVGIPPTLFGVIVVARALAAVLLIRWVGNIFASPIDALLAFFNRNLVVATLISLAVVAVSAIGERVKRRRVPDVDESTDPDSGDPDLPTSNP